MKLSVVLADKPGTLEQLAKILAENNANVISIQYDRTSAELHLNETILHIACEVAGHEHGKQLIGKLKESGYKFLSEGMIV